MASKSIVIIIASLVSFISVINFKPSEPYLTEYLSCSLKSDEEYCKGANQMLSCTLLHYCTWRVDGDICTAVACFNLSSSICKSNLGFDGVQHCEWKNDECTERICYKDFSENTVNNEIYPWSTFAYLPLLLFMSPFAEIVSYRIAILVGSSGRIVCRFLLLYGGSLVDMQVMQIVYAMGSAAEDIFYGYIYHCVPKKYYQSTTSYVKIGALISHVFAGILADILVSYWSISLYVLFYISAVFVCVGVCIGLFASTAVRDFNRQLRYLRTAIGFEGLAPLLFYWVAGNAVFQVSLPHYHSHVWVAVVFVANTDRLWS